MENASNVHNAEIPQSTLIPQNQNLQSTQDNITSEDLRQFINLNTDVQVQVFFVFWDIISILMAFKYNYLCN